MRRLIRYLKAAWLYSQFAPYVEEAEDDGFWTEGDAQRLYQFLQSQTGMKLKMRLTNYYIQSAQSAVTNPATPVYKMGVAAGINLTIVSIENHFAAAANAEAEEGQQTEMADQLA